MRKHLFLLSFIPLLVIGGGSAVFVFNTGTPYCEDNNVNIKFDDIRDNYELGEEGDNESYIKKYNVYFFAQSDFDPSRNSDNSGPSKSYLYENTSSLNFGQFEDGSYYKVLRDINTVYASDLEELIGEPTISITDSQDWPLNFNGWTLTQNVGNYRGGSSSSSSCIGSFPFDEEAVDLLIPNVPLSSMLNYYLDSQGNRKYGNYTSSFDNNIDLYVYPIYTSGKDYYGNTPGNNPIQIKYSDGATENSYFMNEGSYLNNLFDSTFSSSNITAYNHQLINLFDVKTLTFDRAIYNNGMWGSWVTLTPQNTSDTNIINNSDEMLKRLTNSSTGLGSGMYSIYALTKTSTSSESQSKFTEAEINLLHDNIGVPSVAFYMNNYQQSFSFWILSKTTYYVSTYVCFVRHYEPRIIGGPTMSMDYDSKETLQYTMLRDTSYSNLYVFDDIEFDSEGDYYNYDESTLLSQAVFGIQIDKVHDEIVEKYVGNYENDPLVGKYSNYNNANYISKLSTLSELELYLYKGDADKLLSDNRLFKVNGYDINDTSVGFGTYSIAIRLNCIDKVINGITVTELESLDLYVYREHDVYIVVASNPTIPTFFNSLRNNNVFVRPDTDTLAGIDFIATETYQNSYLNLNSAIFFDVNGFIETVDDSLNEDGDGYVSMRDIIQYYESLGIEIYDRLTGYIFNEHNLENYGFKLSKNTILQTRIKEV